MKMTAQPTTSSVEVRGRILILAFACLVLIMMCASQTRFVERVVNAQTAAAKATTATNARVAIASPAATAATRGASPKAGETAPDFKLPYATQEKIYLNPDEQLSLAGMRGKNIILAFYPADWSGGCTKEVCTLRDTFAELSKLNATVLGVSGDYVFSHQEWAKFHKLQFPLLSDHDHAVARLYGVYNEKAGFDNRSVFLIDKNGVVRYSNTAFKAGNKADYDALRAELEKLK